MDNSGLQIATRPTCSEVSISLSWEILCMERYTDAMDALVAVTQCEDGKSLSAPRTMVLNRLHLLPRPLSSLMTIRSMCQVTPHFISGRTPTNWKGIKSLTLLVSLRPGAAEKRLPKSCSILNSFVLIYLVYLIGASLSKPHTSGTALRKCNVLVCLRPYTVNFKCVFKYLNVLMHLVVGEGQCCATARALTTVVEMAQI